LIVMCQPPSRKVRQLTLREIQWAWIDTSLTGFTRLFGQLIRGLHLHV
jgi:hypothetical protein